MICVTLSHRHNVYFSSSYTKETQWTHPRTGRKKVIPKDLPFGWSKTADDEGKTVFVQHETGNKTYTDPRLAFAKDEKQHVHDFRQRFDGSSTAFDVNILFCDKPINKSWFKCGTLFVTGSLQVDLLIGFMLFTELCLIYFLFIAIYLFHVKNV